MERSSRRLPAAPAEARVKSEQLVSIECAAKRYTIRGQTGFAMEHHGVKMILVLNLTLPLGSGTLSSLAHLE